VGYGTFLPVRVTDIRRHRMHAEPFTISARAAETINAARADGKRVVSVGTTCVRTLEHAADSNGEIQAGRGSCDLFIYPGYRFKAVDAMITNFHLPRSTLLMLVSAFAGRQNVLNAYREAIRQRYRFYSYGDAMFIY
jgi:S-adenosylmethionine:tRNA ribosyltransferase-isomerase